MQDAKMTEDEYSTWAVQDIVEKYLIGEKNNQVWTIIMSLFANYYDDIDDKETIKEAMMNVMDKVDSGELDEIRKDEDE